MLNGDLSDMDIIYDIKKSIKKDRCIINLFGCEFVKNYKNICKIIIDNNEYEITEKLDIREYKKKIIY